MNSRNQSMPDAVCLLQPTSPLRTVETINKCIEVMEQGARSVTTVYNGVHPKKSYYPNGEPVFPTNRPYDKHIDKVLTRSGSVFITRTEYLLDNHLLWMPEFVVTSKIEAIDIDDYEDWYIAEAIRMRMDEGN
jgi:CMP-N-acetylneuraminic acid synthetase